MTVTKYDAYGTVLNTTTVDIDYMENSTELPVYGDGSTHYFFHGPTFDYSSYDALWDPDENDNVLSRDYGAVKGTDVRDLCDLVGGMDVNDYVLIKAQDNFAKSFDYDDVYTPDTDEMRMVLCWYNGEESITGEGQGVGYPPDYNTGMRLHFFADTSNNPWGHHCFGIWDMHENLDPNRWHYYYDGNFWPSSSGLSVKWTNRVEIYQPKLISCGASGNPVDSFAPGDTVYVKGIGLSASTSYKLWIQPEPVMSPLNWLDRPSGGTYTFSTGNDPSGTQETVTTNATGDFDPAAIWSAADTTGNYDIVADNQAQGTAGKYDNKDAIDNPGRQGFVVAVSPEADFSTDVTSGCEPLTVSFTDTSTGPATARAWDFGDGYTATVGKPVHVYRNAGTYTVTLNVRNAYGSDDEVRTNHITVFVTPVANFSANVTSGCAPLSVSFTDTSTGTPTAWAWDFNNDGTVDSADQNPVYEYQNGGTYTVKLTVTNAGSCSDSETKTNYITVRVTPVANFSANVTSGCEPLAVSFTDTSTGPPTSRAWDFGDGNTSTLQNPVHVYQNAGTYTVTLNVTNACGSDSETKTNYITVFVPPVANFSANVTSGCAPLTVSFTDLSTGAPTAWAWDFDNNGTVDSADQNPVYEYQHGGTYTVKLTVTVGGSCSDSETKTNYITVSEPPTAPTAAFTADVLTGEVPLTVHFTDQSTGTAPLTYAWDFDNNGTVDSTDQNPVYNYTSAGTYTVKLNVSNAYGSDEEVKTDYITVTEHGVCGDVNNDGKLTMGDGRLIYLNVIYGDPLANPWAADVNDDDKLTMGDGRLVYLHVIYGAEEYPLNCGS